MAEIDAQAYAVTSLNAAAGASNSVETQQPGGSGALRQVVVLGDGTTRGNIATVNAAGALVTQGYQPAATAFTGIIATGAQASTVVTNFNVGTVTLRTFTGTTPSVTFKLESSDDNTNWVTLQGINNNTGQVGSSWVQASALSAGTAGPSIDYTIGAYSNVRINVTAISGTSATAAFGLALQTMPYEASPGAIAQGTSANATAILGNPVLVGGSNGTNAYYLKTDTTGQLAINTAQINGVTPLMGNGATGTGALRVATTSDGTLGTVTTVGTVTTITNGVKIASAATGGATTFTLNSAASTNGTNVKASAGTLYSLELFNNAAYDVFFKMYNKASAPTVGTDTIVKRYKVPSGGGLVIQYSAIGQAFGTGISYATTKLQADTDTTVLVAGDLHINGSYA